MESKLRMGPSAPSDKTVSKDEMVQKVATGETVAKAVKKVVMVGLDDVVDVVEMVDVIQVEMDKVEMAKVRVEVDKDQGEMDKVEMAAVRVEMDKVEMANFQV